MIAEFSAAAPRARISVTERRWRWFGGGGLAGVLEAGLIGVANVAVLPIGLRDDLTSRVAVYTCGQRWATT